MDFSFKKVADAEQIAQDGIAAENQQQQPDTQNVSMGIGQAADTIERFNDPGILSGDPAVGSADNTVVNEGTTLTDYQNLGWSSMGFPNGNPPEVPQPAPHSGALEAEPLGDPSLQFKRWMSTEEPLVPSDTPNSDDNAVNPQIPADQNAGGWMGFGWPGGNNPYRPQLKPLEFKAEMSTDNAVSGLEAVAASTRKMLDAMINQIKEIIESLPPNYQDQANAAFNDLMKNVNSVIEAANSDNVVISDWVPASAYRMVDDFLRQLQALQQQLDFFANNT